jgi:hypothetical protein
MQGMVSAMQALYSRRNLPDLAPVNVSSAANLWQRPHRNRHVMQQQSNNCCKAGATSASHLLANLSVDRLSANASMAGLIMHIMVVLQLPPKLSSRMRVSLLSR